MNSNETPNPYNLHYNDDCKKLLSMWQHLYYKSQEAITPSSKSQCIRGFINQINVAKSLKILSPVDHEMMLLSLQTDHSKIIDGPVESGGLNNFSAEALSLAKLKNTEIEKWRSRLKADELLKNFKVKKVEDDDEQIKKGNEFFQKMRSNWELNKKNNSTLMKMLDINKIETADSAFDIPDKHYGSGMKRKRVSLEVVEREEKHQDSSEFRTAKEQLKANNLKSGIQSCSRYTSSNSSGVAVTKKSLGTRRVNISRPFVCPILSKDNDNTNNIENNKTTYEGDERLKNIDPKMVELITNEIMDHSPPITWDDIAGLEFAKKTIKEIVVLPILRPDIFTGLRGPPKGLLLFGPPGTGKTLIGKCIASQSKSTFFSISSSSLTSKWIGDGEKMVRALFAVARHHQPAVIFIDEIDSLLTQRNDSEHEASRRMKTEILIQLDGAATNSEDKILVVGATNRPQELDEAARRRLVKRLYIPLPEIEARKQIIRNLLKNQANCLSDENINDIGNVTEGYSGADMANLCKEAALGPIRSLSYEDIENISLDLVRPISYEDFLAAIHQVKASVSESDLTGYLQWNSKFGSTNSV